MPLKRYVLITGGIGYIGSHTVVALIDAGYNPIIVDNLSNSKVEVIERIARITKKKPPFYKIDLRDSATLDKVFNKHQIDSVIHFAGLKAVGESVAKPLRYYENNIQSAVSLFNIMTRHHVKKLIFSSSAMVYGDSSANPLREDYPVHPTNPYARTKLIIEQILKDIYLKDHSWRIFILRYFNPIGAHPSGLIGEDPKGIPANLFPYITQVAVSRLKRLCVFGNDYATPDGTCIRDYIHVVDVAEGHLAALKKIEKTMSKNSLREPLIINLGTGRGNSVMEILRAFEKSSDKKIPYRFTKRRLGDVAVLYADTSLAEKLLGWKAKRDIYDMCSDAWRWQLKNPFGYSVS